MDKLGNVDLRVSHALHRPARIVGAILKRRKPGANWAIVCSKLRKGPVSYRAKRDIVDELSPYSGRALALFPVIVPPPAPGARLRSIDRVHTPLLFAVAMDLWDIHVAGGVSRSCSHRRFVLKELPQPACA